MRVDKVRRMGARVAAGLMLLASACEGPPAELVRLEGELQRAADEWSEVAWGAPQDDAQRAATSQRARCVWDELSRAGRDPVPDLECQVLRMRAGRRCHQATPAGQTPRCEEALEAACPLSQDFMRAVETGACRPAR